MERTLGIYWNSHRYWRRRWRPTPNIVADIFSEPLTAQGEGIVSTVGDRVAEVRRKKLFQSHDGTKPKLDYWQLFYVGQETIASCNGSYRREAARQNDAREWSLLSSAATIL
jgi:hypothetical protein